MSKTKVYGNCIFCGHYREMHGEHMWDRWLRRYLPRSRKETSRRVRSADDGLEGLKNVTRLNGDPGHKKVNCVCGPCNNGWMSEITDKAKSALIPLIKGERHDIVGKQRDMLVNWIALKVITNEFDCPAFVAISNEDRLHMYNDKTCPLGWKIWIGNIKKVNWHGDYAHDVFTVADDKLTATPGYSVCGNDYSTLNTQFTTYVVGELFVCALTGFNSRIVEFWNFTGIDGNLLKPIWPPAAEDFILAWPPSMIISDRTAERLTTAFRRAISNADGTPRHFG